MDTTQLKSAELRFLSPRRISCLPINLPKSQFLTGTGGEHGARTSVEANKTLIRAGAAQLP